MASDLAHNDRAVHVDFFNGKQNTSSYHGHVLEPLGFDDIFDDEKLD